jgi:glutamyl-tRNA reductase
LSVLVVGASHRSASVELLEQLAVEGDSSAKLARAALDTPHVSEALVVATCNRVEIHAEVDRFHGSVEDLTRLLLNNATATSADDVLAALYVHYDEAAVAHVFTVATGLDSMVVGEAQILGQLKAALTSAQTNETVGPTLNTLFQQGIRVGKRAHAETAIDRAGQSLVSVALQEAADVIGPLDATRVAIVGAGSIAALSAASVRRAHAADIVVLSRNPERAQRLAAGIGGRAAALADLVEAVARCDVLISCTGATGTVLDADTVAQAMASRPTGTPLVLIDLALPHDIEPSAGDLPGVTLIGLGGLAESVHNNLAYEEVAAVKAIVAEEVAAFVAARAAARVAPTLVALRSMATGVVADELDRLWARTGDLTPQQRSEIAAAVRRVADKLLHEPTVRIKELADQAPSSTYADALVELFALDPATVAAVTKAGDVS